MLAISLPAVSHDITERLIFPASQGSVRFHRQSYGITQLLGMVDTGQLSVAFDVKTFDAATFKPENVFNRLIDQELALEVVDDLVNLHDH
jgi:hypothetical protein